MECKTIAETAKELFERCLKTLETKKHDYSKVEDEFSNFKISAMIAKVKPEQSMLILVGTKVARLSELLNGKNPKNESIDDTIIDLINYVTILKSYRDKETEK